MNIDPTQFCNIMASTTPSASPMADCTNQSRSASAYDTAKSHLPLPDDDTVGSYGANEDGSRENRMPLPPPSPSIMDGRFFQPPSSLRSGVCIDGASDEALKDFELPNSNSVYPFIDYTGLWNSKTDMENLLPSDRLAELWKIQLLTPPRPFGLPLDPIYEGGSYSSISTTRSFSAIYLRTNPSTEPLKVPNTCRRSSSAPNILVTVSSQSVGSSALYTPKDGRIYYATNTIEEMPSHHKDIMTTPETWPARGRPLRAPGPSIREIFERLVASGFVTKVSRRPEGSKNIARVSGSNKRREACVYRMASGKAFGKSTQEGIDVASGPVRRENWSIISDKTSNYCPPTTSTYDSPAIAALKKTLSAANSRPQSTLKERPLDRMTPDRKTLRSLKIAASTSTPSAGRKGSSTTSLRSSPSVKDIADVLRQSMAPEDFSQSDEDIVALDLPSEWWGSMASASIQSLENAEELCGKIPPQRKERREREDPITVPFDDPIFDQCKLPDPLAPLLLDRELTPSPLRPHAKSKPKLSLFPAPPHEGCYDRSVSTKQWRSISSLLRFSTRDTTIKGSVYQYNCRHGHRIISTTAFNGHKIRSCRFHTDLFRINQPENCWRCSAKDVCYKIWQSLRRLRQKHEGKGVAPLFIDPTTAMDAQGDSASDFVEQSLSLARSTADGDKSKSVSGSSVGRTEWLKTRKLERFILPPKKKKPGSLKATYCCQKCDKDNFSANRVMTWVTKNVVLCGDVDESLDAQPCRLTMVKPATVRSIID